MSIFELLYGFQGRISRAQWWLGQAALLSMLSLFYVVWSGQVATSSLVGSLIQDFPPPVRLKVLAALLVLSAILSSALIWMAYSLAIKRVHDRGRSGWRTLGYAIPVILAELFPSQATNAVMIVIAIWYVLELGCFRGYPRHNQYGPPAEAPEFDGKDATSGPTIPDEFEMALRDATGNIPDHSGAQIPATAKPNIKSEPAERHSPRDARPAGFGRRNAGAI